MACIVPQPIIPCEAGAEEVYISGVCPNAGHLLTNGSGQRFDGLPTLKSAYIPYDANFSGDGAGGVISEASVSAWIKIEENNTTSTSNWATVFSTYAEVYSWIGTHASDVIAGADKYMGFWFGKKGGKLWLQMRNGYGSAGRNYYAGYYNSNALLKNQWYHVAFTFATGTGMGPTDTDFNLKLYIDGFEKPMTNEISTNGTILSEGFGNATVNYTPTSGCAAIGFGRAFSYNTNQTWDGLIANVGYWHRVLTPAELSGQHLSGAPADLSDESLKGYWPLNNGLQGVGTETNLSTSSTTIGNATNSGTFGVIDVSRPAPQIQQEVIDISDVSATTAIYYNLWQSPPVDGGTYTPGGRLDEISMFYTAAGGGGGGGAANIITASDTLVSNVAFSTVSGNAVIIDSRTKVGVKILAMNSAFDCTLRKDTSGGDIISYVPAGNTRLRASIAVPDGTNVYLDGDSNTTLTYSWTHSPIV